VSNLAHWLKIDYNGTTFADEQYTGYQVVKPEFEIPISQISSTSLTLNFSSNSQTGQADRNAIIILISKINRILILHFHLQQTQKIV